MRAVLRTSIFHVYDDALSVDDFQAVWEFVQTEEYSPVDSVVWDKVWRLTDGRALAGPGVYSSRRDGESPDGSHRHYPTRRGIDKVIEAILSNQSEFVDLVGRHGREWTRFSAKSFLYPPGAGLSWHADSTSYTGAYIFFAHPEWKSSWGGELMVADESCRGANLGYKSISTVIVRNEKVVGMQKVNVPPAFDSEKESEVLLRVGVGQYIHPKPNRLVVLCGGIPHRIAKVDPAAGENVRCSIAGFFQP